MSNTNKSNTNEDQSMITFLHNTLIVTNNINIKQSDMIQKAAYFISDAKYLMVGAGAGMGKDSGLPDFRGDDGFWNNYPPYKNKFNFYDCANPNFLQTQPHLFWGFYGSRLKMYREKKPHKGYNYLQQMCKSIGQSNIYAITSNIDGHFQKARFTNENVYEVHGSIHHLQCTDCQVITSNTFQPQIDWETMSCKNLPYCSKCNKVLRPNILMFQDWQWIQQLQQKQRMHFAKFEALSQNNNVALVQIGCGLAIPTIRNIMKQVFYRNSKAKFIRINIDSSTSTADCFPSERYVQINLSAQDALFKIKQQLQI